MVAKFIGILLQATEKNRAAFFYRDLGLEICGHAHGGPRHFELASAITSCMLEIYQSSPGYRRDALMIEVDNLEEAITVVEKYRLPKEEIKENSGSRFVYITDPDEREVMLFEST